MIWICTIIPCQSAFPQPSFCWEVHVCRLAAPRTLAASLPCGEWCCCLCQRCCSKAPWCAASPSSGSVLYLSTSAAWKWKSSTRRRRRERMRKSAGSAARGVNSGVTVAPMTVRTVTAKGQTSRRRAEGTCVMLWFRVYPYLYVCLYAAWVCRYKSVIH